MIRIVLQKTFRNACLGFLVPAVIWSSTYKVLSTTTCLIETVR